MPYYVKNVTSSIKPEVTHNVLLSLEDDRVIAVTGNTGRKFREVWTCGFQDMQQTYTDTQTRQ